MGSGDADQQDVEGEPALSLTLGSLPGVSGMLYEKQVLLYHTL